MGYIVVLIQCFVAVCAAHGNHFDAAAILFSSSGICFVLTRYLGK